MKKGDMQSALADFNSVLEPMESDSYDFCDAYFNRGLLYFEQGEYEKAIQDFSKENEFSVSDIYEKRRAAYLALGKMQEADETLESIKRLNEEILGRRYSEVLF